MTCVYKIFDKNGVNLGQIIAQAKEEAIAAARQGAYPTTAGAKFVKSQPAY